MIRAAIVGGGSTYAGEVIKLLVNHPDVEITQVYEPPLDGHFLYEVHKGLRGETYMRFSADKSFVDAIDVLFLCHADPDNTAAFLHAVDIPEKVKIIDLSGLFRDPSDHDSPWVYALPELNRKPLVRGATKAVIPGELATAALLGLLPMAKNLMLNADIHASAVVPDTDAEPGEPLVLIDHEQTGEITAALRSLQSSFSRPLFFVVTAGGWTRGISLVMYFKCNIAESQLRNLYEDYYSDHGFTFISDSVPSLSEVVGTGKCIINIRKVDDRVAISVAIDNILKGAAAQAVHTMNLLFGLQERVGLTLLAIR